MEYLKIPATLYVEILRHSQEEWPLEACGIMAGTEKTVKKIYRCQNVEKSPVSFAISPEEQLKVMEDIEKNGLSMIGIYHSHPHTDPYLSERDLSFFFYPGIFWLIVSLKRREKPRSVAFIKENDLVKEVEITLI